MDPVELGLCPGRGEGGVHVLQKGATQHVNSGLTVGRRFISASQFAVVSRWSSPRSQKSRTGVVADSPPIRTCFPTSFYAIELLIYIHYAVRHEIACR